MSKKIDDARYILKALGLPPAQQNEISAYTLLALCNIKPKDSWSNVSRQSLTVTKGIMQFIAQAYKKNYAPNTRETFRRQVLHQFVQAHVADYNPDAPDLPTNSPRAHYAISAAALRVIQAWKTPEWEAALGEFHCRHGRLELVYRKQKSAHQIPVTLRDGKEVTLSPGKHNRVQAAVVEHFSSYFAPNARLLYLGDTAKKNLILDAEALNRLGIAISDHDKLPDIILFDSRRKWLFLIEAVTSHGPMSPKRVKELKAMFGKSRIGLIFVSAFPDFTEFRKHMKHIAWDTEVWIAEIPDHLIHYNGDRFLGPR